MFGRLTWSAIPFDQPIIMGTSAVVGAVLLSILILVAVKGWGPTFGESGSPSVDHKRIGVMYLILGLVMLVRGFSDAIMMRTQLALAAGHAQGYLPPEHYDQVFSAHGTIMIFFVAMPFVIGLMNFVVPLQLGVRDVAFPVLNSVSFWLTAAGVLLVNLSLFVPATFARTTRVACLSALERVGVFTRSRGRLLPLVIAAVGHGYVVIGRQPGNDDTETARAGHGLLTHAGVLLDRAGFESADRGGIPGADRDVRHAAAGPLLRFPLLH